MSRHTSHVPRCSVQLEQLLGPASEGAWIGLSDILTAGTFAWRDGARYKYNMCMVHSTQYTVQVPGCCRLQYTRWRPGQPNPASAEQRCVWVRPGEL